MPERYYDRDAALVYARKYWNRVCSDGYVCVNYNSKFVQEKRKKNPRKPVPGFAPGQHKPYRPDVRFERVFEDETVKERIELPGHKGFIYELDDCTHFISCCIGKPIAWEFVGSSNVPKAIEWRKLKPFGGGLPILSGESGTPPMVLMVRQM
jgi:hypothetical protein